MGVPDRAGQPALAFRLLGAVLVSVCLSMLLGARMVRAAEPMEVVLLGIEGNRLARIANELRDSGVGNVAVGAAAVSDSTDLVLFTVIASDGPQPRFKQALDELDGKPVARAAIVMLTLPYRPVDDPELVDLMRAETMDLLQSYQISDLRPGDVLAYPDPDFASKVADLLRQSRHDHQVSKPPPPSPEPEPPQEVSVSMLRGVPLNLAIDIIEDDGLVPVVLPNPRSGLVSTCYPEVREQIPDVGTVVPRGTSVGITVPHPDALDPEMQGCLLPQLTQAEVDARIAELREQSGVR